MNHRQSAYIQTWHTLLLLIIGYTSVSTAFAEIHVYRNSYGQLLFSDEEVERTGYTFVRTLGSLAFAPPSALDESRKLNSPPQYNKRTNRYDQYIKQAAYRHNVDAALVKAVIHAESAFNRKAVSHAGAEGLMQLMPRTAASYDVTDPFNPRQNINAGTKHLKYLMKLFNNDIDLVLAAYNAGQANVWKYNGIPPFKETRNYVVKVKKLKARYEAQI